MIGKIDFKQIDFQSVLDNLPGIAFVKDLEFTYVTVNRQYLDFKKMASADDVVGKTDFDLYPESKARKIRAEDEKVFETGKEFITEHYNAASGKTLSIVKVPLIAPNGSMVGIFGQSFDITAIKDLNDALGKSERLYRLLAENVKDLIWTMDLDLRLTYVSPSIERMSGWTQKEALNLQPEELMTSDSLDLVLDGLSRSLAMERKRSGDALPATFDIEQFKKDGGTLWTEVRTSFLRDESGVPRGILGVSREITERRNLENRLLKSQKLEAVGRLAGGISHDFNNALSVILSYAGFVKDALPQDSPVQADLDEIVTAGRRAAELTRQLLSFSRRDIVRPQVVSIKKILVPMEKLLKRTIGEDILLTTDYEPDLRRIRIDPGSLEQVVFNLTVNSRDAMPNGGRLSISFGNFDLEIDDPINYPGLQAGPYLLLKVCDTGVGMTHEVLDHIFEPFYTTGDNQKSSGLGVPAIYGIVRQAGGEIFVTTELGKGTTFNIYFPSTDDQEDLNPVIPSPQYQAEPKGVILVIEDEEPIRNLISKILTKAGYEVYAVPSGMDGLRIASTFEQKIILLITDVVMPEMTGSEVAKRFSAIRPDSRILFMSGYSDETILTHGVNKRKVVLLRKPFTKDGLILKIREALRS